MESTNGPDKCESVSALDDAVYQQLKRLAQGMMVSERQGHTLSPTDLVHEAFLRLSSSDLRFEDDQHRFRTLARQMRRLLVDYGRSRSSQRNSRQSVLYTDSLGLADGIPDFSTVNDAIDALESMDQRSAQAIELVYFAALPQQQAAQNLSVSLATVERDLKFGRAFINEFIHNQMNAVG